MRAIVFDAPGDESVLHLDEVPAPAPPGPDEVRIRVQATAVNRADLLQRRGMYPPPRGASSILGLECAGTVAEVGSGVRDWSEGDHVMALLPGGGYAEEVVVHGGSVMPIPEGWSMEEAGAFPEVYLTVFLTVFRLAGLRRDETVLVHGGGSGVGTATIQMARVAGARVIVTAGTEAKCSRCRELGANRAVCYRDDDFVDAAREETGGRGVDVILDCIGGPYLARNLEALAVGGRLVCIGLMGGGEATLSLTRLLTRRLQILGSTLRSRDAEDKAELVRALPARFGAALADGRLRPVVDRVLPWEEAAEAHRVLRRSEHFGKVVLRVRESPVEGTRPGRPAPRRGG